MPLPLSSWLANPLALPSSSSTDPSPSRHTPKIEKSKDRRIPRGLWRTRVTLSAPHYQPEPSGITTSSLSEALARLYHHEHDTWSDDGTDLSSAHENDLDHDDSVETQSNSSSRSHKKRRLSLSDTTDSDEAIYWDYSRQCSPAAQPQPQRQRESSWTKKTRVMDTSSLLEKGSENKTTCDYEDWEDLKELFSKAVEQYERDDASEALPMIRGVIHECHRFLLFYQDPSVLFTNPSAPTSPFALTPPEERLSRDWTENKVSPDGSTTKFQPAELPTAFHAILGTAFFLFGNLIAQDPSLALQGEPDTPLPYWYAALDVFETGENLPSKTSGRAGDYPEDWRMAIVWGRTLVCIADEKVNRERKAKETGVSSPDPYLDEPKWPPESPFAIIAKNRPPITRRMSLSTASAHDLMKLAMDQFSRGIFHMPHPQHSRTSPQAKSQAPSTSLPATSIPSRSAAATSIAQATPVLSPQPPSVNYSSADSLTSSTFSRAKELFTIASEVLLLAEKLSVPSQRQYWANWADSVFNQMKMEMEGGGSTRVGVSGGVRLGSMDEWRRGIYRMRGQAMLIIGTARAEEFEEALMKLGEGGEEAEKALEILKGEDAEDAREALGEAIGFFEKLLAMKETVDGQDKMDDGEDEHDDEEEENEDEELKRMLAEALLTLANLTLDEEKREELYNRAEKEGGMVLQEHDEDMEVDA